MQIKMYFPTWEGTVVWECLYETGLIETFREGPKTLSQDKIW